MVRNRLIRLALVILVATISAPSFAGSATLTNARAQRALNIWLGKDGKGKIDGVLEIPAQNSAKADITFTNLIYDAPKNDPITAYAMGPGGGRRTYSGHATAYFIHYTDGRWILVRIEAPFGVFNNINITAP